MTDLKISQSETIGPSQLARMELEPPARDQLRHAGRVPGQTGKTVQSILLGKQHTEPSRSPSPFGGGISPTAATFCWAATPRTFSWCPIP